MCNGIHPKIGERYRHSCGEILEALTDKPEFPFHPYEDCYFKFEMVANPSFANGYPVGDINFWDLRGPSWKLLKNQNKP